jgi:hypothetical protein
MHHAGNAVKYHMIDVFEAIQRKTQSIGEFFCGLSDFAERDAVKFGLSAKGGC